MLFGTSSRTSRPLETVSSRRKGPRWFCEAPRPDYYIFLDHSMLWLPTLWPQDYIFAGDITAPFSQASRHGRALGCCSPNLDVSPIIKGSTHGWSHWFSMLFTLSDSIPVPRIIWWSIHACRHGKMLNQSTEDLSPTKHCPEAAHHHHCCRDLWLIHDDILFLF